MSWRSELQKNENERSLFRWTDGRDLWRLKTGLAAQRWGNTYYKYNFSPVDLSSGRVENEVLADRKQPTDMPSTKSHVSYCAARAHRRDEMAAEGTSSTTGRALSSRFLSLLLTAAIVTTCPTPLPFCSPFSLSLSLSLSLSDQVWCIAKCDCVYCTYYATNSRRATAAPKLSASFMRVFNMNCRLSLCSGWATGSLNLGSEFTK